MERAAKDGAREIDMLFVHFGYDKMVPPTARYMLAIGIITLPITLLIVLLCCCGDDEEPLKTPQKP